MYHQEGGDTLYVGGRAMIYVLTFNNRGVRDLQVRPEAASPSFSWWSVGGSEGWGGGQVPLELPDRLATPAGRSSEVLGGLHFLSKL